MKIWSTVEPKGKTAFLTAGNRRDGAATSQKSVAVSEIAKQPRQGTTVESKTRQ